MGSRMTVGQDGAGPGGGPDFAVSVVVTVLNEGRTIRRLLDSLVSQTRRPDEVIVVDGGSVDETRAILAAYSDRLPLRIIEAPGANIARGRNLAIQAARGPIIAVTDAGVWLAPDWLERLIAPFADQPPATWGRTVVCGFFLPDARTMFELAMGATVLPWPDEVDPARFLPSSRSVAFGRDAWAAVGGYPEWLDYCEDLVFDLQLKAIGCHFAWAPAARVYFQPRSTLGAFFVQYYRYARGDGKADLWRARHTIRYATYGTAIGLLALARRWPVALLPLVLGGIAYCWRPARHLATYRPHRPARQLLGALALVPIIRLVGDIAKMIGYPVGIWWRLRQRRRVPSPLLDVTGAEASDRSSHTRDGDLAQGTALGARAGGVG